MIYKLDFSQQRWRSIYSFLYEKALVFTLAQGKSEELLKLRFSWLVMGAEHFHMLVDFFNVNDPTRVRSHCFLNLLFQQNGDVHVLVEEMEILRPHRDDTFVADCEYYTDHVLRVLYPRLCKVIIGTTRNEYRAYERKYG